MKEVTLEELYLKAEELNEKSRTTEIESPVIREKIADMASRIAYTANTSDSVTILTDYDADGICSAYIMQKMLQGMNPDLQVDVICNDRREAYGVPKFIAPNPDTQYIVLDMGSNEYDYIQKTLGRNTLIIDHHLIENADVKMMFEMNTGLLNPHFLHDDDTLNADYCATGLVYRVYTELAEQYPELSDEKTKNTLTVVACIGTVTDMVNVADEHSQNRFIIQEGLHVIHNEGKLNETLHYVLEKFDLLNQNTTAKDIAFHAGAFINSASRMSSMKHENGVSRLNDVDLLKEAVKAYESEMTRDQQEVTVLKIPAEELGSKEILENIQLLEPIGTGFKIPPVIIEGQMKNLRTLKNRDDWKSFSVEKIKVADWSYSEEKYPKDENGNVKFLAELSVSNYKGSHIEGSAVWSKEFYDNRRHELEEQKNQKKTGYEL